MADTKKFEVRLESQVDDHFRIVNLRAVDAKEARARCEEKEADLCAYTVDDEELEQIQLNHYVADGRSQLDDAGRIVPLGRIVGPDATARARLHAHLQAKPYRIVDIKEL